MKPQLKLSKKISDSRLVSFATILVAGFSLSASAASPSDEDAYRLADEILAKLSLEEKISLCHGSGTMTVGTIPKVGIEREFQMSDNSSTIRPDLERFSWDGNDKTATAFPSLSALGATWDRDLASRLGDALGKEARARGKDMLLGPGANIHRTPLCGRNWEYPSEDPILTSKLIVPYIQAVQQNNVAATVKHFVLNNQELARHSSSSEPDERTLREIYLPAFEAAVREGGALAVMNGYNRVYGEYCSHSSLLNNEILKGEWGFQGLVVTDWGSLHNAKKGAFGGTDIEMDHGKQIRFFKKNLLKFIKNGEVPESLIDDKVRRVLYVMAKTKVIGPQSDREKGVLETPEHATLARLIAEQSITLLKNNAKLLPLNPQKITNLLVVGNNAVATHCPGGGSATANPKYEISPLEGIQNLLGDSVNVEFHDIKSGPALIKAIPETWIKTLDPGASRVGLGQPAYKGEYFSNPEFNNKPSATRYDPAINFNWKDDKLPTGIPEHNFSVRWTAVISPEKSGDYVFAASMDDGARVFLDDKEIFSDWQAGAERMARGSVRLVKGKSHQLRVEYMQLAGDAICRFGLEQSSSASLEELTAKAKDADTVIIFTGNNHSGPGNVETEAVDRESMELLPADNNAIDSILSINNRTVIVNLSGAGVEMPWIDRAHSLVQYYFSGQEGGNAIANVLFGKVNPSGKLPFTMPVRLEDSPAHALDDYNPKTLKYAEGVFVGYRWFDAKQIEPLFPFGHGLSYTEFKIGDPQLSTQSLTGNGTIEVEVQVTNTGDRAGSETVQLYLSPPKAEVPRPWRELKDFGKVSLKPGERKTVTMSLNRRDLSYWDVATNNWKAVGGNYRVDIGTSSREIKSEAKFSYQP